MNKINQEKVLGLFEEIIQTQSAISRATSKLNSEEGQKVYNQLRGEGANISIDAMMEYIKKIAQLTREEFYLVFRRFDRSRNGFITQRDFMRSLISSKRQKSNTHTDSNEVIQSKFSKVIEQMLESERILQVARHELQKIPLYTIFCSLDIHKLGYLSRSTLQSFFTLHNTSITKPQLDHLLTGLRVSHWKYINLQVLGQTVCPFQLGLYEKFTDEEKRLEQIKYRKKQKKQEQQRYKENKQRALQKSKHGKSQRRVEMGRNVEEMNRKLEEEIRRIKEEGRKRDERRRELEQEKQVRRDIIKDQVEINRMNAMEEMRRRELADLRRAEEAEEHLNYILQKQAQLNDLELYDCLKRNEDYQKQVLQTLQQTAKKRSGMQRPLSQTASPKHLKSPSPQFTLHYSPSTSYFKSINQPPHLSSSSGYFQPQLSKLLRNKELQERQREIELLKAKQFEGPTQQSWYCGSSRKIQLIEDELRRTELELEVRKGKIEIQQKVFRECQEIDKLRRRYPYIPTI